MNNLYLMNTTIMPNLTGCYSTFVLTSNEAASLADDFNIISALGHKSSSEVFKSIFSEPHQSNISDLSEFNRITIDLEDGDAMLCYKLKSRPPEGVILDLEDQLKIGFDLTWINYHA